MCTHTDIGFTAEDDQHTRTCYIAVALWVCGFVLQGAAFQRHFPIAVLVVGWICGQTAAMMNTFAICEGFYQPQLSAISTIHPDLHSAILRRVLQRLFPKKPSEADSVTSARCICTHSPYPGRNLRTAEPGAQSRRLERDVLSGGLGHQAWCSASIRCRSRYRGRSVCADHSGPSVQGPLPAVPLFDVMHVACIRCRSTSECR